MAKFHSRASIHCHDTITSADLCDTSTCTFTIAAKMDQTYTFAGWGTSGQAGVQSATTTPTTFYVYTPNSGNHYTGSLTLCNTGQSGCVNSGGCVPATMSQPTAQIQSGYQQAWVSWTFSGTAPVAPSFEWWVTSGDYLSVPEISTTSSSDSINLNDLSAGTTYHFQAGVVNCGGAPPPVDGSFTTSNAPTTEFVGWVYYQSYSRNLDLLNDVGGTLSGAEIGLSAQCVVLGGSISWQDFDVAATSDSTGHYQINFPVTASGSGESVSSSGVCTTPYGTHASPHYTLYAWDGGQPSPDYMSGTHWVSSALSATNDFVQFMLVPDTAASIQVGLALVHTSYPDISCGFTYWTQTQTSQVDQTITVGGYSGNQELQSSAQSWNSPGGWGDNNALNLIYPFGGNVNETAMDANVDDEVVAGSSQGANANPVSTTGWVTLITTPPANKLPNGWHEAIPNSGQGQSNPLTETIYSEGTYSSTTGVADNVAVTVGWGGFSVGWSWSSQATTTISTSITTTTSCAFTYTSDPSHAGGVPVLLLL